MDDNLLLYRGDDVATTTLKELKALGVDRVRVNLIWKAIAPYPDRKPRGWQTRLAGGFIRPSRGLSAPRAVIRCQALPDAAYRGCRADRLSRSAGRTAVPVFFTSRRQWRGYPR